MEMGVETGYGYALLTGDTTESPYLIIGQSGVSSSSLTKDTLNTTTCYAEAYNYKSLESIKKNITDFNKNAIDIIKNGKIYEYNYKHEDDNTKKHIGFVIPDLKGNYIVPSEVLTEGQDAIQQYNMSSIMWKAIQEQQQQIEELQNEINLLKGEKYGEN